MEHLLLELLTRLEGVRAREGSLFDTAVRETMDDSIFYGFLKPEPGYVFPDDFCQSVFGLHTFALAEG